jgi:hypothetical protein
MTDNAFPPISVTSTEYTMMTTTKRPAVVLVSKVQYSWSAMQAFATTRTRIGV